MNSMLAIVFVVTMAVVNAGYIVPAYYSAPLTYSTKLIASPYGTGQFSTEVNGGAASEDTVIAGPSGTISTSKNIAGPAVATRYAAALTPVYNTRYAALPYTYVPYGTLNL